MNRRSRTMRKPVAMTILLAPWLGAPGCGPYAASKQVCTVTTTDGVLGGVVRDSEGPWRNTEVRAQGNGDTQTTRTGADGAFSFDLAPGEYKVRVTEGERGFIEPHTGCCGYSECEALLASSCTPTAMVFEGGGCDFVD